MSKIDKLLLSNVIMNNEPVSNKLESEAILSIWQSKPSAPTYPVDELGNSTEDYNLGKVVNGSRLIGPDQVKDSVADSSGATKGLSKSEIQDYNSHINKSNDKIDDFKQGKRGDCYLLAVVNGLKNITKGQNFVDEIVTRHSDGSMTVALPGAMLTSLLVDKDGYHDNNYITGSYTISKEALDKAKSLSGKSYAYGDIEVIALELAVEAAQAEIFKTKEELGDKFKSPVTFTEQDSLSDILDGGHPDESGFLLTGIAPKWKSYQKEGSVATRVLEWLGIIDSPEKCYVKGEYGYAGDADADRKVYPSYEQTDFQNELDYYRERLDDTFLTVSVISGKNGPDGKTVKGGGHALVVTNITDDYVEVSNSWDTRDEKRERIPRGDFEKMVVEMAPINVNNKKMHEIFYALNYNPGVDGGINPINIHNNVLVA